MISGSPHLGHPGAGINLIRKSMGGDMVTVSSRRARAHLAAHGTAGSFHVHPSLKCNLFAQGIDLIWESVGGDMFTTCTRALAQGGRLIVIGMMSQYSDGWAASKANSSSHCQNVWMPARSGVAERPV